MLVNAILKSIDKKRQIKRISIKELAESVDVAPSTLTRLFNGETSKLSIQLMENLLRNVGIDRYDVYSIINNYLEETIIHNINIQTPILKQKCIGCSKENADVKIIKIGEGFSSQNVILCEECRKNLITALISSVIEK